MDKNILYKNYLETKIYLTERDGSCNYANDLRRKYPELLNVVDISKIFIKIVNYRVKKYGTSRNMKKKLNMVKRNNTNKQSGGKSMARTKKIIVGLLIVETIVVSGIIIAAMVCGLL